MRIFATTLTVLDNKANKHPEYPRTLKNIYRIINSHGRDIYSPTYRNNTIANSPWPTV
jgi:hypothetical protein